MTIKELVQDELQTPDDLLTRAMLVLERKHKLPIKLLIAPIAGVGAKEIASYLGIAEITLSEWRKRFGYEDVRTLKPGPKANS